MKTHRRSFLGNLATGLAVTAQSRPALAGSGENSEAAGSARAVGIDFRYAPPSWQTAFCFPDDPYKSLVGERGELRYGHPGRLPKGQRKPNDYFPVVVEFSLDGMEPDLVARQQLEGPGIPIIYTRINRPRAFLELTTFATQRSEEGRVDNVILEFRPVAEERVRVVPLSIIRTRSAVTVDEARGTATLAESGRLLLAADRPFSLRSDTGLSYVLAAREEEAAGGRPLRWFLRFPQQGQDLIRLRDGLKMPEQLLAEARDYWQAWRPCSGSVSWSMPGPFQDFTVACARNMVQACEVKHGRRIFQVGPTVYRGMWVTDSNYILEAARYLGYDGDSQQGLEAIWELQEADGGIYAGAGRTHWKDNGIALFMLVRQAELSQDWSYFRKMQPNVLRTVDFLVKLRERARNDGNANSRYGLLPQGFPDGGWWGPRAELANTIGVLPGLKAVAEAAERQGLSGLEPVRQLYKELKAALAAAARQEMRRHPAGFAYLPALLREDAAWSAPDPWDRPRPQSAQWALANAIFPGLAFEKDDPIVRGYVALMRSCTREDVPVETGFLHHEGLWTYDAAFAAHVYLWAGLADWARQTFVGFLNHASPLYCWREEQPQLGSLVSAYLGDMPHNQAGAWCILYLRHMLALEDGRALRLLAGIGDFELRTGEPYFLVDSPTRFGRLHLSLEPLSRKAWQLRFQRQGGPAPGRVELPAGLGARFHLAELKGARSSREGGMILVDPEAASWTSIWKC